MQKQLLIDLHCGGPKIYNSYWNKIFFDLFDKEKNIDTAIYKFNKLQLEKAINGNLPKYLSIIKKSNLVACIKTIGVFGKKPLQISQLKEEIDLVDFLTSNNYFIKITNYNDLIRCYKKIFSDLC